MREQVIQALATLLASIPGVNQVTTYEDASRVALTGLPAIMVVDAGEERLPLTGDYVQVGLDVDLHGIVAAADDVESRMNALDDSIKVALAGDRTLGGLVSGVVISGRTESDLFGDEAVAKFIRPVRIYYSGIESQGV